MRNLLTGQLLDKTFSGYGLKLTKAPIENRECTFLFEADGIYTFMDSSTFDQYEVQKDVVGEKGKQKSAKFLSIKHQGPSN